MRMTSRTPSSNSKSRWSKSRCTPTAPRTVCDSPVERCTLKPLATSRSMTCWIWASVALSCITMTIDVPFPSLLRPIYANFDVNPNCGGKARLANGQPTSPRDLSNPDRENRLFIPWAAGRAVAMHGVALGGARLVDNPLEQAADGRVGQGSGIVAFGVRKHFVFAIRLIQRDFRRLFKLADFERALRTLVEKLQQLLV